jgi:hypothetical protein
MHLQQRIKTLMNKLLNKKLNGDFIHFLFFYLRYSTLLHLPPLRFHRVGGCWDRTQVGVCWNRTQRCCDRTQDAGIEPKDAGIKPQQKVESLERPSYNKYFGDFLVLNQVEKLSLLENKWHVKQLAIIITNTLAAVLSISNYLPNETLFSKLYIF